MKGVIFLLLIIFLKPGNPATCVRFLQGKSIYSALLSVPGRIWRWNKIRQGFEHLESWNVSRPSFISERTKENSNNVTDELCSVDFVDGLRGQFLTVDFEPIPPYVMFQNNVATGYIGDVWRTMEDFMGFKTIYRRTRPLTGPTLMNGRAHALLVASAIQAYPSSSYSYSLPIATNSYALFVLSGGTQVSGQWYTRMFTSELWLATFGLFILISVMITGIFLVKKRTFLGFKESNDEMASYSFNLLYILSGITGQGLEIVPRSWSLRLVILSTLFLGMCLSCAVNTTLTSYLSFRRTSTPVNNLHEVAEKRTHSLCVRNDSFAYLHLKEERWRDLVNTNDCPDMRNKTEVVAKVCHEGLVFLEGPDVFLSLYKESPNKCPIVQLPGRYWSLKLAFLHSRSSTYRRVIDRFLLRLNSAGILKYLERKWILRDTDKIAMATSLPTSFQPVEYEHISILSLGSFLALLFSIVLCVGENILYKAIAKYDCAKLPSTRNPRLGRYRKGNNRNGVRSFGGKAWRNATVIGERLA